MNIVTNALSHIHEVNIVHFTKIKLEVCEQVRGKYLDVYEQLHLDHIP